MTAVVDTNVLLVANGRADHAGPPCVRACVDALTEIRERRRVVLDRGMRIFDEYIRQRLSFSGQPGAGDAFFRWLFQNQADELHCLQFDITPRDGAVDDFEEFPSDDPRPSRFDWSDRKFVAIALASRLSPPVYNAVDSDWWDFRDALAAHGVTVVFLCPSQFQNRD